MTYEEESYVLNKLTQIARETHENNVMLRYICSYVNAVLKERSKDEQKAFEQNILANIVSEVFDGIKSKTRKSYGKG